MRVSEVARWGKRITLLKVSTVAIIVTSILSAAVMLVTYYGDAVGNYVISVNRQTLTGLSLSKTSDRTIDGSTDLFAEGIKNLDNITYANIGAMPYRGEIIDANIYSQTEGGSHNLYIGNKGMYFAYTFYLRNEGNTQTSYSFDINVTSSFLGVDEAVRVMVIRDGTVKGIFGKADDNGNPEVVYEIDKDPTSPVVYEATPFLNDVTVCSLTDLLPFEAQHCYTIIMWLEGADPQCNNSIKGGSIRLGMTFTTGAPTEED